MGGENWCSAVFESVDAAADVEGVIGGCGDGFEGGEEVIATRGLVLADSVMFVHCVELELL